LNPGVTTVKNGDIHSKGNNKRKTCRRKGVPVSTKQQRVRQLDGFSSVLSYWLCQKRLFCSQKELFQFLFQRFETVPLDQMASTFKLDLATFFSKELGQELPEGHSTSILPVPRRLYKLLQRRWLGRRRRKVLDLWDLLQAKCLSNPVPQGMILHAYEKHGNLLSTVGKTPESVLSTLKSISREWAKEVVKEYTEVCPLAPSKAYFGVKRSQGGCFSALKPFYSRNHSRGNPLLTGTRMDPISIYLYGPPGVGKSFLSNMIVKRLSEIFKEPKDYSCYWRNYSTDHFDGYTGQLIFGIDDAFQVNSSMASPDQIIDQVIQMKSNNEFIVPMANLADKGRKFSSEFLLMSSNRSPYDVVSSVKQITTPWALGRRIKDAVHILGRSGKNYRISMETLTFESDSKFMNPLGNPSLLHLKREQYMEVSAERLVEIIIQDALYRHSQSLSSALASVEKKRDWRVPLIPYGNHRPGFGYEFPSELPPQNRVEAFAIPEPLKVRMITKEQPLSWALKPLQTAMFKGLTKFPCFFPGWKGSLEDFVNLNLSGQSGFILSGDYQSATDNLNMDIMGTVLGELKKEFSNHPHLLKYIDFFGGKHWIDYPSWTKLPSVLQQRGQLMGNLLSFPVLCIANAATLCHLRHQDLSELQACINGDDILFVDSDRHIRSWKRIASSMGLVPSIGKNFRDRSFGTINSQILFRKKVDNSFIYRQSGKAKLLVRKDQLLVRSALDEGFSLKQIVHFGKSVLMRTPESIDVSDSFGGLGRDSARALNRRDRQIYLFKVSRLRRSIPDKSLPMEDGLHLVCIPKMLERRVKPLLFTSKKTNRMITDYRLFSKAQEDSLLSDLTDPRFPWNEFNSFKKDLTKNPKWRRGLSCKESLLPPLEFFKPVWTLVDQNSLSSVEFIISRFWKNLFLSTDSPN